jgi:hypothetical protein
MGVAQRDRLGDADERAELEGEWTGAAGRASPRHQIGIGAFPDRATAGVDDDEGAPVIGRGVDAGEIAIQPRSRAGRAVADAIGDRLRLGLQRPRLVAAHFAMQERG